MKNEEVLMRKCRFTDAQIMGVLRQVEGGLALAEVCWEHAISSATFYK
jgi:putative transposase